MKITDSDRKRIGWAATYKSECPFCGAQPRDECVRTAKDGSKYKVWEFHTTRKNQAVLNSMFIIEEELSISDVLLV